jgi:hypothetical protein
MNIPLGNDGYIGPTFEFRDTECNQHDLLEHGWVFQTCDVARRTRHLFKISLNSGIENRKILVFIGHIYSRTFVMTVECCNISCLYKI